MDWQQIIETLGGTAVILGALAWIARSVISHIFSLDLEKYRNDIKAEQDRQLEKYKNEIKAEQDRQLEELKHQHDQELENLRAKQQNLLAEMQAEAEERLEHVIAELRRMERLVISRSEGYDAIWTLTGALNLFGPTTEIDSHKLSMELKNWYFEHGWVLTQDSKWLYFLVQEVLNFGMIYGISCSRPADELLFGSDSRPVQVLRQLRERLLGIEARADEETYAAEELEAVVNAWKSLTVQQDRREEASDWILLQFVLSAFRSGLVKDLGSRENVPTLRYAEGA